MRGDLVTGQLAPFTGLGTLGDFYLHHVRVHQVVRGDAKATGRHLLDARVLLGTKTLGIFTAFAGVALTAEAVHGDGQGLVGFRAEGADGHGRGVEAGNSLAAGST